MNTMRLLLLLLLQKTFVVKLTHPCLITSFQTLPEIGLSSVIIFRDQNYFGNNKKYFYWSKYIKKIVLQAKLFKHGFYFVPPSEPLC